MARHTKSEQRRLAIQLPEPSPRDIEITNEIFLCTQHNHNIDPHMILDHWEVSHVIREYREELLREQAKQELL